MGKKGGRRRIRDFLIPIVLILVGASLPLMYDRLLSGSGSAASGAASGAVVVGANNNNGAAEHAPVFTAVGGHFNVIPLQSQNAGAVVVAAPPPKNNDKSADLVVAGATPPPKALGLAGAANAFDAMAKKVLLPELQRAQKAGTRDANEASELADMIGRVERNVVTFVHGGLGKSCYEVCREIGLNCGSMWYMRMNSCTLLRQIFPEATSCSENFFGRDLPAYRPSDNTALANKKPNEYYPSCGIGHPLTERPCGCEPGEKIAPVTYHTVYNAQASRYFEWQGRYSLFWFNQVAQPGKWTRLLSASGPDHLMNELPTHVAPAWDMALDPYVPYNKPKALAHWLANAKVEEDVIILVDPDCAYVKPMDIPVREGYPVGNAGYYTFPDNDPDSVETEICRRYCPTCKWFDPIAVPVIIHRKDAEKLAPLWLETTIKIRNDRDSWPANYTDNTKSVNSLGWVAEMYGYVVAAAILGLRHEIFDLQAVPGMHEKSRTAIFHYHISVKMGGFTWNKGNLDAASNFVWPVRPDMEGWSEINERFNKALHDAWTALGPTNFTWPAGIDHRHPYV